MMTTTRVITGSFNGICNRLLRIRLSVNVALATELIRYMLTYAISAISKAYYMG